MKSIRWSTEINTFISNAISTVFFTKYSETKQIVPVFEYYYWLILETVIENLPHTRFFSSFML